jgi:hypothetical protein
MFDRNILDQFARQYGVLSRRQLIDEFNVPHWRIARTRKAGLLADVVPGVLRIVSSPETFRMRCMALQLQTRECGFISGWSAARLRDLRLMPAQPIHFTLPMGAGREDPAWAKVHRTSWYDAELDRETLDDGLIVAAPMRMLFGLAAAFNQFRFERAAEDAWHRKLITPDDASRYLQLHRCRGRTEYPRLSDGLKRPCLRTAPHRATWSAACSKPSTRSLCQHQFGSTLSSCRGARPCTSTSRGPTFVSPSSPEPHGGTEGISRNEKTRLATGNVEKLAGR